MINRKLLMNADTWYIQNGLLLHLDGIYNDSYINQTHTDNPTEWKDLSGNGNDFEMINTTTTQDAFVFNGSNSWGRNKFSLGNNDLHNCLYGVSSRTIEIVFKMNNTTVTQTIFLGKCANPTDATQSGAGLWYRPASKGFKVSGADGALSLPSLAGAPTERASFSTVYHYSNSNNYTLYNNLNQCEKGAAAGNMINSPYITIGARYNSKVGYPLNGEICAIRVYNRTLTTEERLHNYKLDIRRFGLDMTNLATIDE